ncbi:hypothetical protein HUK80_11070 [Flavobacterium sp. MAH-1]|uniref:Uncharacterized protein n=1 Tax=Flavobacterium agri TaxID=2743471 RepID=A0A7Y9C6I2_9FLAO|nr:hypothetical protein [Flavobacterium agri]NUY81440.1 hypothetical protein [Flavobacterium agri]NYA71464.1 hypothetical protein [Flavobacterium agri]
MKKKLEAELISLAHRILQLKNKEDIAVLQEEARKLYEKLSVLRFVEENFSDAKPTIGQPEIEEKLDKAFDYEQKIVVGEIPAAEEVPAADEISSMMENLAASKSVTDEPTASEEETSEKEETPSEEVLSEATESEETSKAETSETEEPAHEIASPTFEAAEAYVPAEATEEIKLAEEANEATALFWEAKPEEMPAAETNTEAPKDDEQDDIFAPKFELSFDEKSEESPKEDTPSPTFTFDDLLGKDYADPVFVTPEELQGSIEASKPEEGTPEEIPAETASEVIPISRSFDKGNVIPLNKDERGVTLNDKLSKGITIGLNDRIAFMKQLFNNSSEDYNRVLSQLITFDNYTDAKDFIDTMVKPDYDDWKGKEEYEQRFLEIIEKRFQ